MVDGVAEASTGQSVMSSGVVEALSPGVRGGRGDGAELDERWLERFLRGAPELGSAEVARLRRLLRRVGQ
jgi:hypothetical protein